ncbi:DUF1643 domain-containing protein [Campylobacter lari]|nr:DUF1643 domain-containing protein [Campylobacter lari]
MKNYDIYVYDEKCRYVLGKKSNSILLCIGVNPSIATDKKADRTIKKLENIIKFNNYESFVMLNIYPEISTNLNKLPYGYNVDIHNKNLEYINHILYEYKNADILACWGNLINIREYLHVLLKDIFTQDKFNKTRKWLCLRVTKTNNPRHPLYLKNDTKIMHFDMKKYLCKN